ncbi:hypothetical protein GWI33_019581 [Rhynchophorus ferrugineus]|uniref:DUF3668 domain-containing protein n=1 Tax=Rhynchophorus ferrugineus TaxID=354439 RepID=A0A834HY12_RHYFE|nr:hypothetical protein GWI33_019581 [Rhynchophorus ferrugineus]
MNQLTGKFVNVVLSVGDGRGMEFIKYPVHIEANFNGRILESDKIMPEDTVSFNTELIWESDKKDLRKLRSSNQPLRVECLCVDPQNRRERIGFVLMSLRSAQVVSLHDAKKPVNFKWLKLIGCQADKKKYHPEINLGLSIRDHLLNDHEDESTDDMPLISEEEANSVTEDNEFSSEFPLRYLEDGYIQIGEDDDHESFSLNLLVKEARNLDALLPELLVFRQSPEKYHLTFKIFGVTIKTKPFFKLLQDTISVNEKVVVRILSNEQMLFDFFRSERISIILYHSHDYLGLTEIELGEVAFKEKEMKCFFKLPPPNDVVPFGGDDASPYIQIATWVRKSTSDRANEKLSKKIITSSLEKSPIGRGAGDEGYHFNTEIPSDIKIMSEVNIMTSAPSDVVVTKSAETIIKNIPLSPKATKKYNVSGNYVRYILHISLHNFMWRISPKEKTVIFKFLHPRASNCISILNQIDNETGITTDLKNIGAKISYVSTDNQVENILNAWPPKLLLTDEREKLLSEEYEFDVTKFFEDSSLIYKYNADIKAIRTFQNLARIQVTLKLEQVNLDYNDNNFHLGPPIVDEILSINEIMDIESWKKSQQLTFKNELEKLKNEEIEKIQSQWTQKKKVLEDKLQNQINKCQLLQDDLQKKADSIKTEKYLIRSRNSANIFSEIFSENWNKYNEADIKDVIEILSKTQRDNEYLKKLVADQRETLQNLEKTSLTKEQTSNLLQELKNLEKGFEEAQYAKRYFKEQWKQACDEIHEMKIEGYKKIQLDIKKSKEELSECGSDSNDDGDGDVEVLDLI